MLDKTTLIAALAATTLLAAPAAQACAGTAFDCGAGVWQEHRMMRITGINADPDARGPDAVRISLESIEHRDATTADAMATVVCGRLAGEDVCLFPLENIHVKLKGD